MPSEQKSIRDVDVDRIKALYHEGANVLELARQFNVSHHSIRARIAAEGWTRAITLGSHNAPLHERVKRWLDGQVRDLEDSFEAIRKLPPPDSTREAIKHEELMAAHLARGRKIFGLDQTDNSGGSVINIAVLANLNESNTFAADDGFTVKKALKKV